MRKIFTPTLLLFLLPIFLFGQSDSITLDTDQLLLQDIKPSETAETKQKVYAATRSLKNLEDLPFTTYVITKEEIRDNGYRTLVDALKMQPGIRISQPGSAIEGELFMMRGLSGNANTKILLNGNVIQPSIVKGMPIGAQLPIQQAERIEIIYGAMGSLYGSNASAGIINIVMEETERPVYTQANLSLGSNEFANLDISFGGRLGKRKRTLRYALYGSYTFRGDLKIQHTNDSLFNPQRYPSRVLDSFNIQNYVSIGGQALINELPHQSRMVGLDVSYQSMKFSVQSMYRRDHSSIGLSPTAVSYTNPTNYLGERIINANFSWLRDFRWMGIEARAQYLQHQMDNQSSTDFVNNFTSSLLDTLSWFDAYNISTQSLDQPKYDSLTSSHFARYFNASRFSYSESFDIKTDLVLNLYLAPNLGIKVGASVLNFSNIPMVNYSRVPLGNRFRDILQSGFHLPSNTLLRPFNPENFVGTQLSTFSQVDWSIKNITIVGGIQWFRYNERASYSQDDFTRVNVTRTSVNPRIGINYKISNVWRARAYYSSAIWIPPPFYKANSFKISSGLGAPLQIALTDTKPEKTQTYELGFRWNPGKKLLWDIAGYYTSTSDRLGYGVETILGPMEQRPISYTQGYFNSGITTSWIGIQSLLTYKTTLFDFIFSVALTYDQTEENDPEGFVEKIGLHQIPRTIRKTRILFRPTRRISVTFDNVWMGKAPNRVNGRGDLIKFRTIDILANYKINRNFRIFFKSRNIFNRESAGLNATGNRDDLIYNPQELRNFRIGMSYRVD